MEIDNKTLMMRLNRQKKRIDHLEKKISDIHKAIIQIHLKNEPFEKSYLSPVELDIKGAEITLLSFAGMRQVIGVPRAEFFKTLSGSDRYNIIFLKDFNQAWYQCGLFGISDNVDDTVGYLKSIIPPSTKRLITLGSSSGGFAAILYGSLLGAEKTISFAPQTFLNEEVFKRFKNVDSKKECIVNAPYKDLNRLRGDGGTIHHVYVGKNNKYDQIHIDNIKDNKRFIIHWLDTSSHNVAKFMKENGTLDHLLLSI